MGATTRRNRSAISRWALVFGVLAVLTGVFAMHGLGDHGAMQHESRSATHAGMPTNGTGDDLRVAGPSDGDSGLGSDVNMVGLCLAVLGGLLLVLGAVGLGRSWRVRRPGMVRRLRSIAATHRDRDPPSLLVLTINRC